MTASTKTADRIPLTAMHEIITAAMAGLDLAHDTEWARPPDCPCHDSGLSCLHPGMDGACQGHTAEVDTLEQHQVTAGILIAALEPDSGYLDARQAALSVIQVIESRLTGPYVLRRDHLRKRLIEEAELWETSAGLTEGSKAPAVPVSVLTCQWCQGPIPLARGPKARYCRNSHRVSAHRAKKRQANATAAAGR